MKSRNRFLVIIFFVGLILRLAPVMFTYNLGIGLDDMFQYDMLARSLVEGKGYRWYAEADLEMLKPYIEFDFSKGNYDPQGMLTSFRPPLYPLLLAGVYELSGITIRRFFWARLVQALIGALLAPLTYLLALKLGHLASEENEVNVETRQKRFAPLAAWVVALYPMLLLYPLALATENLFFPLVLVSILVTLTAVEKRSLKWFLLAGVIFGLTALTRSVVTLAGVAAAGWTWFIARQRKGAVLFFAGMLLTMAPWVVRNTLLHKRFTWIESAFGYQAYVGYHPKSTGTFTVDASFDLLKILDDDERNQAGMAYVKQFILADPSRVITLAINRLGYFFGLERRALTYFYSNGFFGYIPLPLLLLIAALVLLPFVGTSLSAAFGMARPWKKADWLVVLFSLAYLLPNVLIIAEERFHMALVPFLAIYATQAWTGWKTPVAGWRTHRERFYLILAIVVVLLLCLNWGLELYRDADMLALLLSPSGHESRFPY
jgi:4-amino-4-deoxy-L-arabinose transferase-like glycosyltransferase